MTNITHKNLALLICAASVGALAFAYTAQYGFNLQPCILCLYQRKPYFAVIALSLLAAFFADRKPRTAFALLLLSGAAFVVGMGIAGFHTGVENGWWKGLDACGDAALPENATLEQMQEYIMNRPIVRCDVAGWKFLGISMTGYNFMLSTALAAFTFFFALRKRA